MLLREIKLLETDRTPLQTSLGQLGVQLNQTSSRGGRKDLDVDFKPLIDQGVVQMVPATISDDAIKKLCPTKSILDDAIENLAACKNIIRKQQDRFSTEVSVLDSVARLAASGRTARANKTQINAWLDGIENIANIADNDIVQQNRKSIVDLMNADRVKLINALMNEATATTWAENSARAVRSLAAKRTEAQDMQIAEMIKNFHAVLGQLYINAGLLGEQIEKLRDSTA